MVNEWFAAKYAKRSTVLRAGDAEYRFSLPRAADATSYVRVKRGHGTGSQPMRRFSAETFPVRPVSSSGDSEVVQPDQGVWLHQARWGRTDVFVHISAVEKAGYTGLAEGAKVSYVARAPVAPKTGRGWPDVSFAVPIDQVPAGRDGTTLYEKLRTQRCSRSGPLRSESIRRRPRGACFERNRCASARSCLR